MSLPSSTKLENQREGWPTRLIVFALFPLLLLLVAAMTAEPIDFQGADLGRHLKNGEIFITQGLLPDINFYAFTEPAHPTINHHWASGVLFYLVWQAVGFVGLHIAYIVLHVATVGMLMWAASKRVPWMVVICVTFLLLPLLSIRKEIRPEGLSYFFLAIQMLLLVQLPKCRRSLWQIGGAFALLSVLWVNCHIYFFLGWVLTAAFLLEARLQERGSISRLFDVRTQQGRLALILLLQILASLLNPAGFAGAVEPFVIFREFGIKVEEMLSLPHMFGPQMEKGVWWFLVSGIVSAHVAQAALWRDWRIALAPTLLLAFFFVLAFMAVRGVTLFALIALPMVCTLLAPFMRGRRVMRGVTVLALAQAALLLPIVTDAEPARQFGLKPGVQAAGEFIRETGLEGPFFNDFDTGGYFIFHLFPRQRPFVDNRPEAYSAAFFKNVFVPMIQDEQVWKNMDAEYGFNSIVIRSQSVFASDFIARRKADPDWSLVFMDHFIVVFAKRSEQNAKIIERYGKQ